MMGYHTSLQEMVHLPLWQNPATFYKEKDAIFLIFVCTSHVCLHIQFDNHSSLFFSLVAIWPPNAQVWVPVKNLSHKIKQMLSIRSFFQILVARQATLIQL